ncbi:MAG: 3-deoxy-7-phosphoheptulonate synthase [Spirochaetaceae bacterium]|nr:3-deoxy-7-phosphoheptulonate synthase [Spirochaetaceae bacterium]
MVIVLQKGIPEKDKQELKDFLVRNNFKVNEITGEEDTILGAVGKVTIDPREVEILPGVERVIPISKPYKMASREYKKENTVVEVKNNRGQIVRIGGNKVLAIAGPCAVESLDQMMGVAARVSAAGAAMLRGGAFKPRTSPYAFQGLGEEGVKILRQAGDAYGLPIVTEIVSADHIPLMKDYVDVYQIGARNMQNFELLKKVGALGKPVILKRGLSATIEEWLMAAEYLLSSGTDDVILCERGIRTYEKATRNTLDLSAVPVIRSLTHLPIIIDPSHAVGIRDKVPPMGLAAIAAGADGIIVEVHCQPEKAVSDAAQTMYPEQFEKLMRDIDVLAPVVGKEVTHIRPAAPDGQKAAAAGSNDGRVRCAYSGDHGAYAEQAISLYFDDAQTVGCSSFRDVFQAVTDGRADYGMIPLENSLAGSVYDNYDNLFRFDDVSICGAYTLRIEHALLAVKGASLDSIKRVYSHPHGFPQCKDFLDKHPGWIQVDAVSTATAAELVAKEGSLENAAIASSAAADYYNLEVLATGIELNPRNYTRFVVITANDKEIKDAQAAAEEICCGKTCCAASNEVAKASLVFIAKNKSGSLYECLGVLHQRNLNMTRLESRPIMGEPWRYMFYVDLQLPEGGRKVLEEAVGALKSKAEEVRLLGIYKERSV